MLSFRIVFRQTGAGVHRRIAHAQAGTTVLAAGIQAKAGIPHKCGGQGSCGTCRIHINPRSAVNPPTRIERFKLSDKQLTEGDRLACQIQIGCDLEVDIPESALSRVVRKQLEELHRNKDDDRMD
ncbi:MAG: hypothetical protein JWN30_1686 [Bacilli bacterium]|nr:hypothetical protein [Bacilli bacterium]